MHICIYMQLVLIFSYGPLFHLHLPTRVSLSIQDLDLAPHSISIPLNGSAQVGLSRIHQGGGAWARY